MTHTLIVNADDLGVSKGASLGIIKSHREGIVTSASLVATTPFYTHALEACVRTCPELGVGLHFTLTSGRPVSPVSRVPLLVDTNGFFRWRFLSLLRSTSVGIPRGLLDQIEIELDAQIKRLIDDGVHPDHINGERHVHLIPAIFDRVVAAAKRHNIPFVRLGRDVGRNYLRISHLPTLMFGGGFIKSSLLSSLTSIDRRRLDGGIRSADFVASYLYTGQLDLVLASLLKSPPPDGVLEIMVHPGLPEESRNLGHYLTSEDRRREMNACIAARGLVDGWKLVTFGQLARERVGQS